MCSSTSACSTSRPGGYAQKKKKPGTRPFAKQESREEGGGGGSRGAYEGETQKAALICDAMG